MITIEITFRPIEGGVETLWAEVEDRGALTRLQELTESPDATETVITLHCRITPTGPNRPRLFRASRVTFREVGGPDKR